MSLADRRASHRIFARTYQGGVTHHHLRKKKHPVKLVKVKSFCSDSARFEETLSRIEGASRLRACREW